MKAMTMMMVVVVMVSVVMIMVDDDNDDGEKKRTWLVAICLHSQGFRVLTFKKASSGELFIPKKRILIKYQVHILQPFFHYFKILKQDFCLRLTFLFFQR